MRVGWLARTGRSSTGGEAGKRPALSGRPDPIVRCDERDSELNRGQAHSAWPRLLGPRLRDTRWVCLRERRVRFRSVVGLDASGMIFVIAVFSIRLVPRRERLIVQYLHYGHTRILVSDMVGKVVLAYSASLAQAAVADTVAVPTVDDAGLPVTVQVMLAPAIPVLLEPAPEDALEDAGDIAAQGFLTDVRWRISALPPTGPGARHRR